MLRLFRDLFFSLVSSLTITVIFLGLFTVTWPVVETGLNPEFATAATSSNVTVSASITATISCSTNVASTSFGTLTSDTISTSSENATSTLSCANSAGGCTLYVKDAGDTSDPGLYNEDATFVIPSPNAADDSTATLSAGTNGYGIQAVTSTAGEGAALVTHARYYLTGNVVGGLEITNQTLVSTAATTSGREVGVIHKAAVATSAPAGDYADTITYECIEN